MGPTDPSEVVDQELSRWSRVYTGEDYYYGDEPGPVARRAFRYHRPWLRPGDSIALDAGCGEGQDLVYLAGLGYRARGVEFTPDGAAKARRLVGDRAEVVQQDLRTYFTQSSQRFDLVLAVNSLQFLGSDASGALDALMERTAPGGVLGVSLFAREDDEPEVRGTIWFTTLERLLERFRGWQCQEAAKVWQWDTRGNRAQPFVTLIARNLPPSGAVPLERAR